MWWQKVISICVVGILLLSFALIIWSAIDRNRAAERAPDGWKRLHTGMSSQEVVSLIGYPVCRTRMAVVPGAPQEDWYYGFSGTNSAMPFGRNVVTFKTGTVTRVEIR